MHWPQGTLLGIALLIAAVAVNATNTPSLTAISPNQNGGETLVWSNSAVTGYCHLLHTWDPAAPWYYLWINLPVTNPVMSQSTWRPGFDGIRESVTAFSAGRIDFTRMFYRLVSTTNQLRFPPTYTTNMVRITNLSPGTISNVVLVADCFTPQHLGTVYQGVTTGDFAVVTWNPVVWDFEGRLYDNPCLFLEVKYEQDGQPYDALYPLQHYGLPGEAIGLTISNSSVTFSVTPD